ncbi:hypothetical protein AVEN_192692-1 [Araneus ventricosus]|uniref:Uncharacterized protein n=1 Tax=Araneus ventricosus TaxID=182803 RepID=A0A4Y2HU32_ARAVE|nr:hypothetical protein AVEN_192692-1 [Araneus ventricosus]
MNMCIHCSKEMLMLGLVKLDECFVEKLQEGYFGMDLTILNCGQMARAVSEPATPLLASTSHQQMERTDLTSNSPSYCMFSDLETLRAFVHAPGRVIFTKIGRK